MWVTEYNLSDKNNKHKQIFSERAQLKQQKIDCQNGVFYLVYDMWILS